MERRMLAKACAMALATLTFASGCAAQPPQAVASTPPPVYKLGVGDKVRITVFGEQSLNGEYPVGSDGTVALPLIGNIEAAGVSAGALQNAIVAKLSPNYILDPRVTVDVVNFRPFYILGEVGRPGSYPYVDALSVTQAIAIAGGYTYRANSRKVFIRRAGDEAESAFSLKSGAQVWVLPGDTIRVTERFF